MGSHMGPKSWVTGWQWRERIMHFEPSWFMIIMSTGALMQTYVNFPYPITGGPEWLRDIGYCLWILQIVLFVLFTVLLSIRYIRHPVTLKKNILEFPQSSYLGAIPISLSFIIIGIVSYYNYHPSARWAAFGIWWIDLTLALLVGVCLVTVQTMRTPSQEISDVAGLWLMTTVPLFTVAGSGANMLPYLNVESPKCAIIVLVISFLCWSWAMGLMTFILAIYLFRLLASKLPNPKLLASSFLPVAALSQAAFAFSQMSIFLASYIKSGYAPTQVEPPPLSLVVRQATAEAINWLGILVLLFLLGNASFWFLQATAALCYRMPKQFNISLWSLVFPIASYTNSWAFISRDLRNNGMRGWAAFLTVLSTLLWLGCAVMTAYLGFWKGSLFNAPGLEDWIKEEKEIDEEGGGDREGGRRDEINGTYSLSEPQAGSDENGNAEKGTANGNGHAGDQQGDGARQRRQ